MCKCTADSSIRSKDADLYFNVCTEAVLIPEDHSGGGRAHDPSSNIMAVCDESTAL